MAAQELTLHRLHSFGVVDKIRKTTTPKEKTKKKKTINEMKEM